MGRMDFEQDDYLAADILGESLAGVASDLETEYMPSDRAYRIAARRRFERQHQQQSLLDVLKEPPASGESVHIVSDAKFDFWTWVPAMLIWIGRTESLYCSTWTLARSNAVELFEVWDAGTIGMVHFLTGTYFKRRETAVYALLLDGLRRRGGRFRAFQNHAKVLLLDAPDRQTWLTIEGSANLTSNPRCEQYVITNNRGLWEFHRGWMEEALTR